MKWHGKNVVAIGVDACVLNKFDLIRVVHSSGIYTNNKGTSCVTSSFGIKELNLRRVGKIKRLVSLRRRLANVLAAKCHV